ncbi:TIGR04452 family lipoprotein [Leptospira sarikeiensis]|uniref:TIGR04452 family lipoprotein n=1 Tax=Leptospira sarikeiensis TaxID=2484943 RepID=A0A4R9KA79_9LEPT|nr:TIGR04452 family lipoprotein [Leptospira sarikeiensis]TGL62370.1 TIGR04452 family lipoprotein [Leptospira sarikeiensis]
MRIGILPLFFFILIVTNCVALNTTGLTNRYKGSEAKDKIEEAATVAAQLYAISTGDLAGSTYINNIFLPPILVNLQPSEYYKKEDVNACVEEIKLFGALKLQPTIAVLFGQCSNLQPDNNVYGNLD